MTVPAGNDTNNAYPGKRHARRSAPRHTYEGEEVKMPMPPGVVVP